MANGDEITRNTIEGPGVPSHGDGRPSNESNGNLSVSSSLHRRGFFRRKSSASREQEDLEEGRAQQARVEDEKS